MRGGFLVTPPKNNRRENKTDNRKERAVEVFKRGEKKIKKREGMIGDGRAVHENHQPQTWSIGLRQKMRTE
jgi:hypothetical protein